MKNQIILFTFLLFTLQCRTFDERMLEPKKKFNGNLPLLKKELNFIGQPNLTNDVIEKMEKDPTTELFLVHKYISNSIGRETFSREKAEGKMTLNITQSSSTNLVWLPVSIVMGLTLLGVPFISATTQIDLEMVIQNKKEKIIFSEKAAGEGYTTYLNLYNLGRAREMTKASTIDAFKSSFDPLLEKLQDKLGSK